MAACGDDFEEWLCAKLKSMNTDHDVFSSYIRSILDGNESNEEKYESLEGLLLEIVTDGTSDVIGREILDKWNEYMKTKLLEESTVELHLTSFMEKHVKSHPVHERKRPDASADKIKLHNAIVAQYGQVSDVEEDVCSDEENDEPSKAPTDNGHFVSMKNVNVENALKAEKEKREKNKLESEKKKAQDKLDREKQKQEKQERKEKERKRTQKGERKR